MGERNREVRADDSSRQNILYHLSVDVCQTTLDAVVVESEFFVIQPQQVQNGGVEVTPVHGIIACLPADVVGAAVSHSRFQARTSHPNAKAVFVVIAPGTNRIARSLCEGCSAELGGE